MFALQIFYVSFQKSAVFDMPKVYSPNLNDENNSNANNISNYIDNDLVNMCEQEEEDALINISDGVLKDVTL